MPNISIYFNLVWNFFTKPIQHSTHSQLLGLCRVIYLNNFTDALYSAHINTHTRTIVSFSWLFCASRFLVICFIWAYIYCLYCVNACWKNQLRASNVHNSIQTHKHALTTMVKNARHTTFPYPYFSHISICTIFISFIYTFPICVCVFESVCVCVLIFYCHCKYAVNQSINIYVHFLHSFTSSLPPSPSLSHSLVSLSFNF